MINFFKKKLLNFLSNYFERIETNNSIQTSVGLKMGNNSLIEKPKIISGTENIIIGDNTVIGHSIWLSAYDRYRGQVFTPKIVIGSNVNIGHYACITAIDEVKIENGCLISQFVYISDHYHGIDPTFNKSPKDQDLLSKGKVEIGENTFLGFRVTILSGVKLGRHCVVGSHSVVNRSFPEYSMIAGAPAKLIKKFDFDNNCWKDVN